MHHGPMGLRAQGLAAFGHIHRPSASLSAFLQRISPGRAVPSCQVLALLSLALEREKFFVLDGFLLEHEWQAMRVPLGPYA